MHHYLQSVADTQDLEIRTMPRITYICRQGHRSVRFLVSSLQFLIPAPLLILISYTELCSLLTFPTMCKVIANCCCAQLHPHPPLSLSVSLPVHLAIRHLPTPTTAIHRYEHVSPIYNRLFCQFHVLRSPTSYYAQ